MVNNNVITFPSYVIPGLNTVGESSNEIVTILVVIVELAEPVRITPTG